MITHFDQFSTRNPIFDLKKPKLSQILTLNKNFCQIFDQKTKILT